jgi:hypothetical protein
VALGSDLFIDMGALGAGAFIISPAEVMRGRKSFWMMEWVSGSYVSSEGKS